jgi:hypothetical protein
MVRTAPAGRSLADDLNGITGQILRSRAAERLALVRIPTHAGHLFRDDVGHHSDLMPATVPR